MNQSNKDGKPSAENEEEGLLIRRTAGQPNTHPNRAGNVCPRGWQACGKVAKIIRR